GVALEHLDGHRATVGGAQQAVDDLQIALLAVAVGAAPRELAAAAFHIARGQVVEHQRAVVQMLARKRLLDRLLALAKPVERDIELVLVDRPEADHLAEARAWPGRPGFSGSWCKDLRRSEGADHAASLHRYYFGERIVRSIFKC